MVGESSSVIALTTLGWHVPRFDLSWVQELIVHRDLTDLTLAGLGVGICDFIWSDSLSVV